MRWLHWLFPRSRRYEELAESIREHLEEKIADLIDGGMPPEEAAHLAHKEFGNVTLSEERSREVWMWPTLESMLADVGYAFRQFRKAPGFFVTAILVLSLGIGASASSFTFVNAALLKPLSYQDPSRLVGLFGSTSSCPECSLSYLDYQDWRSATSSFRSIAIWAPTAYLWHSSADVQALRAGRVSGEFFQTLGVTPAIGRLFTSSDDQPAAPLAVVLPYATWQRDFAGRTDILGQTIRLDDRVYTVVGVLPQNFEFAPRAAEVWVTIHDLDPCDHDRSCRWFSGLARLKDGISIQAAQQNMNSVAAQLQTQYPQSNVGQGALLKPLSDVISGDIRPILLILLAGSGLLLLIACVNVASLVLVRAEKRGKEMAVRGALGASLTRLTRQLAVEAAVLVTVSVSFGVAGAWAAVRLAASFIPERVLRGMPYFASIHFDRRVFLFVAALSLLAWTVCTAAAISRIYGGDLRGSLADGARSSSGVWRRFASNLVVVELAVAIILLATAGVLGKSFLRILQVDLNFNPAHLATFEVDANSGYDTAVQQVSLAHRLIAAITAEPGVVSAGIVKGQLPVTCNCSTSSFRVKGRPFSGTQLLAVSRTVDPGYLATLQARLLQGRFLTETDDATHPNVVLINRTMAQQLFPNEDPLGQTIGDETLSPASLHTVVGVVDDVREGSLAEPISPAAYFSFDQDPDNGFFVTVRTATDPAGALPGITAAIQHLHLGIGVRNEFTMSGHIHYGAAYYLHSSAAWLASAFAACALLLGIIGLYGVIAYSVTQRTFEIGIRMALGAQRSSIGRLVLGEAALLVFLGLGFGIAGSLLTGRYLESLLFGVRSWDFTVLAVVSLILTAAALIAAGFPAARAVSTDPMQALRNE